MPIEEQVSLSSLPTALLIPPLNLLPLGLLGAALARHGRRPRHRAAGRAVIWLSLWGLFVLAMPATAGLLLRSLESGLPVAGLPDRPDAVPAGIGAIVILSADFSAGGVGGVETGSGIGAMTLDRMRAGALLARRTGLPILVSGGVLDEGAQPIAVQMADSLRAEFARPARWVEPVSADTWENAAFSARLLHVDGVRGAYVVTDGWHLRRALMAFAPTGIAVLPAPVRTMPPPELNLDGFIPSANGFRNSYFALHEWIGCLYYWLRLRFG